MTVGISALAGLSASQIVRANLDRHATIENLARNQIEYVFDQAYHTTTPSYSKVTDLSPGYEVTAEQALVDGDANLQKITITVVHNGEQVLVLETYRNND